MQKLLLALCFSLGLPAMEPAPGIHVGEVQYAYSHDRRETFTVEGVKTEFSHRVIFNTALDWAKTAQTTAVAGLQELPGASVVIPSINLPTDQAVVFVGRAVNSRITACVLKAVLAAKPKNLVVCTSSSEYNTIVVGSVHPPAYQPATSVTLEALTADDSSPSMNAEILNAQLLRTEVIAKRQPFPVLPAGPVVDYDFSKNLNDSLGHGKPFVLEGLAQRLDAGLLLMWNGQPEKDKGDNRRDLPETYRAQAALTGIDFQALTVTLTWCPAELSLRRDLLFCMGERWRWFSAHVDPQGRIVVGFNNQDTVFQPVFAGAPVEVDLIPRRWQVISVGYDLSKHAVRAWVDGRLRRTETLPDDFRLKVLESLDIASESVIGFVHMANARRMQGVVANLRIDNGLLSGQAVRELHESLRGPLGPEGVITRPIPQHAIFTDPIPVRTGTNPWRAPKKVVTPPPVKKPAEAPPKPPVPPVVPKPPAKGEEPPKSGCDEF